MKLKENLILDPSFFANMNAVSTLLESVIRKDSKIVVPTLIYQTILERDSQTFISTLSKWEGKSHSQIERVWAEVIDMSSRIRDNMVPCASVLEKLDFEQLAILETIEPLLQSPVRIRESDMLCLEMAKELIETACVASLIISVSDKGKRWYNKFNRVVVKRVEDNESLLKAKAENREKINAAGWRGSFLIWLCKHVPLPFAGDVIDFILMIATNGTYKCQHCGESVWKLPRDISFCPYCSKPM